MSEHRSTNLAVLKEALVSNYLTLNPYRPSGETGPEQRSPTITNAFLLKVWLKTG
jgi:hypothetical protein